MGVQFHRAPRKSIKNAVENTKRKRINQVLSFKEKNTFSRCRKYIQRENAVADGNGQTENDKLNKRKQKKFFTYDYGTSIVLFFLSFFEN